MDSIFDDTFILSIVIFSSIKVLNIAHQQSQQAALCALWYGLFFSLTKVVIPIFLGIAESDTLILSFMGVWILSGLIVFGGLLIIEGAKSDAAETILYILLGAVLVLLVYIL